MISISYIKILCHIHIVPRNKGDGLRGFFWPRQHYNDEKEKLSVQSAIKKFIS
jgi:histidine triad (HIT) family protein